MAEQNYLIRPTGEVISRMMANQICRAQLQGCTSACIPCHFDEIFHREISEESIAALLDGDFQRTDEIVRSGHTFVIERWLPTGMVNEIMRLAQDNYPGFIAEYLKLKYTTAPFCLSAEEVASIVMQQEHPLTAADTGPRPSRREHSGARMGELDTTSVPSDRPGTLHRSPPPVYLRETPGGRSTGIQAPLSLLQRETLADLLLDLPPYYSEEPDVEQLQRNSSVQRTPPLLHSHLQLTDHRTDDLIDHADNFLDRIEESMRPTIPSTGLPTTSSNGVLVRRGARRYRGNPHIRGTNRGSRRGGRHRAPRPIQIPSGSSAPVRRTRSRSSRVSSARNSRHQQHAQQATNPEEPESETRDDSFASPVDFVRFPSPSPPLPTGEINLSPADSEDMDISPDELYNSPEDIDLSPEDVENAPSDVEHSNGSSESKNSSGSSEGRGRAQNPAEQRHTGPMTRARTRAASWNRDL